MELETLNEVLWNKFAIKMDDEAAHLIQPNHLFLALQFHTSCVFQEVPHVKFHDLQHENPLHISHLESVANPSLKHKFRYPGVFFEANELADQFFAQKYFAKAWKSYQIRLSLESAVLSHCPCSRLEAQVAWTTFRYALALFYDQQATRAQEILQLYLQSHRKYSVVSSRMMSLLMTIEMTLGHHQQAMVLFDTLVRVHTYLFGPNHPIHAVQTMTLAQAYTTVQAPDHSHSMTLLAYEAMRKVMGGLHLATNRLGLRLAMSYLELHDYQSATELFNNVLLILESFRRRNLFVEKEMTVCLHGLAISLMKTGHYRLALYCAVRCVSRYVVSSFPVSRIQFLSAFVLLSDLYMQCEDSAATIAVNEDIWLESQRRPFAFPGLGSLLLELSIRSIGQSFVGMSLPCKSMIESIFYEVKNEIYHQEIPPALLEQSFSFILKMVTTNKATQHFERTAATMLRSTSSGKVF